jgi:hypothetical protein
MHRPEVSPDPVYDVPEIIPPPPERAARSRGALETAEQPAAAAKKERKTVTFKPTCTVQTPLSREDATAEEDKSRLYYSKSELEMMNLKANALCILSRALPAIEGSGTHLLERRDSVIEKPGRAVAKDTPRGLELRMYPTRARRKIVANRILLRYQRLLDAKPNMNGEARLLALAGASGRLTAWSTLVAAETARWDAVRAHDPDDYPIPIASEPVDITLPFPAPGKRRRQRQEQEQNHSSRRVTLEDGAGAKRGKID